MFILTEKGQHYFDYETLPIYEALASGATCVATINEFLKGYVDCFAASKKIEAAIGDMSEIAKLMKSLVKQGYVREVA